MFKPMHCRVVFTISILFYAINILQAQQLQRHEVIVVYVYNFAKNIKWQNESDPKAIGLKEFNITVITNDPIFKNEFSKLAKTKTLKDKPIKINFTDKLNDIGNTQLIFCSKEFESKLIEIVEKIEGHNILLVSDNFDDKRLVMINFVESENNKLKFEINKANIINQNLITNPELVLLGGSEIDVASLYKESQQSLLSLQKKLENLVSLSENLQKNIDKNELEIDKQKKLSTEQNTLIQKQLTELAIQKNNLQFLLHEAESKGAILILKNEELKEKEKKLVGQENQIKEGTIVLQSLNNSNDSLNTSIKEKEKLSEKIKYPAGRANALMNVSKYYQNKGNYSQAMENCLEALHEFEKQHS